MLDAAICFFDSSGHYYKQALITAASLFSNSSVPVRLHVVVGNAPDSNVQNRFEALAAETKGEIVWHKAPKVPEDIARRLESWLGIGALFRLMLPQLVQQKRLLYLDCDVVCECDAAKTLAYDLEGAFLGVVPFGQKKLPYFVKRLKLDPHRYFNSGVMLMNLERFRKDMPDLIKRTADIILAHNGKMADQEALNILFNKWPGALRLMPEFFNFRIWQENHACLPLPEYKGKFLHFSGRKPWEQFTHAGIYYWKYYNRLFPDDDIFATITLLPSYEHAELCTYMLTHKLARGFVRRLYEFKEKGVLATVFHRLTQGSGRFSGGTEKR